MLLIAVLATGSLSETEEQTKILANLKSSSERCPLTGKRTFAHTLAAVLASPQTARQVCWVEAERSATWGSAVIVHKRNRKNTKEQFNTSIFGHQRLGLIPGLSVKAELWLPFSEIADGFEAETQVLS